MLVSAFVAFATATSVLAAATAKCPGFRAVVDGPGKAYASLDIVDVTNLSEWDGNTTKVMYTSICDSTTGDPALHEIAFVNLDNCTPISARYQRAINIKDWEKSRSTSMVGDGPIVPVNSKDTVRLQCPRIPQNSWYTGYVYEVHFKGFHRAEMLPTLGFYDTIIG